MEPLAKTTLLREVTYLFMLKRVVTRFDWRYVGYCIRIISVMDSDESSNCWACCLGYVFQCQAEQWQECCMAVFLLPPIRNENFHRNVRSALSIVTFEDGWYPTSSLFHVSGPINYMCMVFRQPVLQVQKFYKFKCEKCNPLRILILECIFCKSCVCLRCHSCKIYSVHLSCATKAWIT